MDKTSLSLTALGVIIVSVIIMPDEALDIAEALYSIPPTPAWDRIEVNSDANYTLTIQNFTEAVSYTDTLNIVSDGSLNISIGRITP